MTRNAPPTHWIEPHPHGIFVRPANAWIDPSTPQDLAWITHGHADHARSGHKQVHATPETLKIMALRYGLQQFESVGHRYGEGGEAGGVKFSFHPAGHVLGSAQILMEYAGERVIVTGDYKRVPDRTCAPFEPIKCDIFITEATFGLPVFRHPPIAGEIAKITNALVEAPERCVLLGAYALGKAQRLITELRAKGYDKPIYLHGALQKICALYQEHGIDLGELLPVAGVPPGAMRGHVVMAPPSALNDRWSRRLPDPITAMASGWMRVRQRARQRGVELPIIISDHADWDELTQTIREVDAGEIWITHGREDALIRWCALNQIRARALDMVGYEDEDEEG